MGGVSGVGHEAFKLHALGRSHFLRQVERRLASFYPLAGHTGEDRHSDLEARVLCGRGLFDPIYDLRVVDHEHEGGVLFGESHGA